MNTPNTSLHVVIATPRQTGGTGSNPALGAANWLSLAAAPTFAIMALLTSALGGTPDMLCSATQGASPLSGMVLMYALMSAFHLAPWLKLASSGRKPAAKPDAIPAACEHRDQEAA
jgi:hypothetical protein